mgnify:FL=1
MDYKNTYLKPEIAFLLKQNKFDISNSRYLVNRQGTVVESNTELVNHYDHLELAYNPNAEEVFEYFKTRLIDIEINKVEDNKWEWILKSRTKTVYSGETVYGNVGANLPESRQYFKSEIEAYNDAIVELIIII